MRIFFENSAAGEEESSHQGSRRRHTDHLPGLAVHVIIRSCRSLPTALGDGVHLIRQSVPRLRERLFQAGSRSRSLIPDRVSGAVQEILGIINK